ncbi:hypothetical protein MUY14_40175 [Amycolatopsis sp. FBCC-B4732]|uniref:hypothetical protein n=1 Tax=Amycolatopsis sp. FBCC-B4732 TaxID=3079339 RepID=UPI001FF495BD|nr:hypothetical protein [Amycolatopsis sp. FBCC-B4732]UOX87861.1 hypothetical protein MUY14_40175 [Amycolatopsis sp. FBCC-B4732]
MYFTVALGNAGDITWVPGEVNIGFYKSGVCTFCKSVRPDPGPGRLPGHRYPNSDSIAISDTLQVQ